MAMTFKEYLQNYKEWRLKEMGDSSAITKAEFNKVRENFSKKLAEAKKLSENKTEPKTKADNLKEAIAAYREWKKENVGSAVVTLEEKKNIAEELKKESKLNENKNAGKPKSKYVEACENYRQFKINEKKDNTPLTEAEKGAIRAQLKIEELQETVKNAKKLVRKAQYRLHEGDMMGGADMTQQAGAAVNQANTMADGIQAGDGTMPATPLPQNIIDEISNIKTSVDSLAQEAGIESPVDFDANATAGVDGVTGVGDPNAQAAGTADPNAGMMESKELSATQKRLAEREKRIAESAAIETALKIDTSSYDGVKANTKEINGNKVDKGTSEEYVKAPGTQALLNGVATGPAAKEMKPAKTWPTKPLKEPSMTKKLGNIEESEEQTEEAEKKIEESVDKDSWAEKMVEEKANKPRFNWNDYINSDANLFRR
jgi:hypothetical protein